MHPKRLWASAREPDTKLYLKNGPKCEVSAPFLVIAIHPWHNEPNGSRRAATVPPCLDPARARLNTDVWMSLNRGFRLRTEVEATRDICEELRLEAAKRLGRLRFILLEFLFFRDSEEGGALPLSLPWSLSPLSLALHTVKSRALSLLRLPCYFVRLGKETVGLLAMQDQNECLIVASLGVARRYRRLGIGTCILGHVETTARRMGKRILKVDVYGKNTPALRFYTEYGFTLVPSLSTRSMMKGSKPVSAGKPATTRIEVLKTHGRKFGTV